MLRYRFFPSGGIVSLERENSIAYRNATNFKLIKVTRIGNNSNIIIEDTTNDELLTSDFTIC